MILPSVLLVEDDVELRGVVTRGLREEGFAVEAVGGGRELIERMEQESPDVLVVDIGLRSPDGRDVCQALRARGVDVPVLFLTARDALTDRLAGFSAGGDDYLTKPFALDELIARLRVLVRRSRADVAAEVSGLRLDPGTHAASCVGIAVSLTPTEFRLIAALCARSGEAVRRRTLVRTAWPYGAMVAENTLDAYVARLRRKLRELPGAPEIVTVHGVGYSIR